MSYPHYVPTFCLDLEPTDPTRPRDDWSYLIMAQHQAYFNRQQQQQEQQEHEQPHFSQANSSGPISLPSSVADDWDLTQAMLEISSPSSMSSLSSMPPNLTSSVIQTLDGPDPSFPLHWPANHSSSAGSGTTLLSKPASVYTSKHANL
jgi:hypothetical protein